jgi:hypothetical protein
MQVAQMELFAAGSWARRRLECREQGNRVCSRGKSSAHSLNGVWCNTSTTAASVFSAAMALHAHRGATGIYCGRQQAVRTHTSVCTRALSGGAKQQQPLSQNQSTPETPAVGRSVEKLQVEISDLQASSGAMLCGGTAPLVKSIYPARATRMRNSAIASHVHLYLHLASLPPCRCSQLPMSSYSGRRKKVSSQHWQTGISSLRWVT